MAEPDLRPAAEPPHAPLGLETTPSLETPGAAPVRAGRIRRLPNGDLVPAHRYEDALARLRAEAATSL